MLMLPDSSASSRDQLVSERLVSMPAQLKEYASSARNAKLEKSSFFVLLHWPFSASAPGPAAGALTLLHEDGEEGEGEGSCRENAQPSFAKGICHEKIPPMGREDRSKFCQI